MKNWYLIIGNEYDNADFQIENLYPQNTIVYLRNNTFQVLVKDESRKSGCFCYEIDLDRKNINDWVMHLSHKKWATDEMLQAIFNSAELLKDIGAIKNVKLANS